MKALFRRIFGRVDQPAAASEDADAAAAHADATALGVNAAHAYVDTTPAGAVAAFADADQDSFRDLGSELQIAGAALERSDYAGARASYLQVLDFLPDESRALYGLGVAELGLGRSAEAMGAFLRALESDRPHPEAGMRLAEAALARGEEANALDLYRRVLAILPDLAEAHFGIGAVALQAGRAREALDSFQRAFEINPEFAEAGARLAEVHFDLSAVALQAGRDGEALDSLRRAFEIDPKFAEAGVRLAEITLANGDARLARDIYRRVLDLSPEVAEAHYGLAIASLDLGSIAEAAAPLKRALAIKPDFPAAIVAAAFLSLFPERRSTRSVRAVRPLICMPILPFSRDWLGGQIYLLNFARILSSLPKWQRPRLLIVMLIDDWREIAGLRQVVDGLLECDAVIGMFDGDRRPISAPPTLERYAKFKRNVSDAAGNWSKNIFASVDWTFPILYPSWGVVTIPGALHWIPDLQHRFWPDNFDKAELMARNRDMAALAARPEPIIFSSHDAQSHFRSMYPQQLSRPYVWQFCTLPEPTCSDESRDAYAALRLPSRFYYTPNQFWPHKDHATLFRALRRIREAGRDITFVCTGNDLATAATAYSRGLVELIQELELGANLRLLGVLPRPVQLEIMRRACAIIQPSLHEGWSTVVEDARAFGRPLIVSDLAVHREQTDGTAHFFPPQDAASLAAVVMAVDCALSPGPDATREAQAGIDQARRVHSSADQFMDILAIEAAFRS